MADQRATGSLQRGIETAKSGNQLLARLHLLQAVELAPRDPNCWLWLAWVADSPASAVHSLERLLEDDPQHELALLGLRWAEAMARFELDQQPPVNAQLPTNPSTSLLVEEQPDPGTSLLATPAEDDSPVSQRSFVEDWAERQDDSSSTPGSSEEELLQDPQSADEPDAQPAYEPWAFDQAAGENARKENAEDATIDDAASDHGFELREPEAQATEPSPDWFDTDDEDLVASEETNQSDEHRAALESRGDDDAPELLDEPDSTGEADSFVAGEPSLVERDEEPDHVELPALSSFEEEEPSSVATVCQPWPDPVSEPAPEQDDPLEDPWFEEESVVLEEPAPAPKGSALCDNEPAPSEAPVGEEPFGEEVAEALDLEAEESPASFVAAGDEASPHGQIEDLQEPAEPPAARDPLPEPAADSSSAVTVLVVDDSPTVRKLVTMTLEKHGFSVASAVDGVAALKSIADLKPGLILLDITMPRLGGYQLCKLIKKHEATKHIPVIMLSGKDGMFDKVRGKFVGCDDYVTKPFDPDLLVEKVSTHLSERSGVVTTV